MLTIEQLPVRRQSHPTPSKTTELIRQELEAYALIFPNISFSFQDASKNHHPHKSHILKIPKVTVNPFPVPHIHITLLSRSRLVPLLRRFDIFMAVHSQRKVDFSFSTALHDRHGTCISQCVEEIAATSGQLQIEGFISLVGAYTKVEHLPFCD